MWRRQAALALNGTAEIQASGKGPSSYTAQLPTPIGPIRATRCRSTDKSDGAVAHDMHAVIRHRVMDRAEFEIKIGSGCWIGETILVDGQPINMVRTFV